MAQKTIAVDIDDVLSATAEGFTAYSNQRWGNTHKVENYSEAWAEFWDVSIDEARKRSDEYHDSGVIAEFAHYTAAVPVLRGLGKKYKIVVITSRRKTLQKLTDEWLEKYFPGVFGAVHYAGIWDVPYDHETVKYLLNRTKAEIAEQIGADYLIDDQLKHCSGAAKAGITALLFDKHAHNEAQEMSEGIVRVKDWQAIKEYFNAQG